MSELPLGISLFNSGDTSSSPIGVPLTALRYDLVVKGLDVSRRDKKTAENALAAHEKLKGKEYLGELKKLHVELVKLQEWTKHKGLKVCIVFEGRDGAGKGGAIKAITERVSPRVFRVLALPAPTEREKTSDVYPAVSASSPGGRRDRDLRP